MNNLEPSAKIVDVKINNLHMKSKISEPLAKKDDVIIASYQIEGKAHVIKQMKVKRAAFIFKRNQEPSWYYSDSLLGKMYVRDKDILKNLTTNTDYTGNDEQQSPKRFVMANECLIHPGTPGHNC